MEITYYSLLDHGFTKRDMVTVRTYVTKLFKRIYFTTEELFNYLVERAKDLELSIKDTFQDLLTDAVDLEIDQYILNQVLPLIKG